MSEIENNNNFIAKKALIVYERRTEHYVEVHQIENGNFLEGRPLTIKELSEFKQMAEAKNSELKKECYPFRHILGFSVDFLNAELIWIYPAGEVLLHYESKLPGFKTGRYFIPNLVFKYDSDGVSVFAIKTEDILSLGPNTELYLAPFLNTSDDGDVCMGSAEVKKGKNLTETIRNVERAFFDSEFTHTNNNKIVKGNLVDAYTKQKGKFDEEILLPFDKLKKIMP
jgi:PRTRC genetic system protein B